MKKKTDIENELDRYYYASLELTRLNAELSFMANHKQDRLNILPSLIAREYKIIEEITNLIERAELDEREFEYIRLRHFEQNNLVQIEFKMFLSQRTIGRAREAALKKLKAAL